ncbi:MAG: cation:proton antiporter subunit C [Lachnospiraceae bacterium]|nr:cation:proton antiporter subunit C [Lachnospiraceae bacterium]
MFEQIYNHFNDIVAAILFVIGFSNLLFQKNLIKKIIGLNIMDVAIYLLLASQGYISGRLAPILTDGSENATTYINPIPSGLVLTGIVVSVSVTALMLSMTIRLYRKYRTLDLDEILVKVRKEKEDKGEG